MASDAEASRGAALRVELLGGLRARLEHAEALVAEMQRGLKRADAEAIDGAGSRLESLLLEFKVLAEEYGRLPRDAPGGGTADVGSAREGLEQVATRLARSSAVSGGLLERLVAMSRRLTGAVHSARGETYLPSGRTRELAAEGLRLREKA